MPHCLARLFARMASSRESEKAVTLLEGAGGTSAFPSPPSFLNMVGSSPLVTEGKIDRLLKRTNFLKVYLYQAAPFQS